MAPSASTCQCLQLQSNRTSRGSATRRPLRIDHLSLGPQRIDSFLSPEPSSRHSLRIGSDSVLVALVNGQAVHLSLPRLTAVLFSLLIAET